jgi:flagellar biosynthesis/type III secretory pathway protein FliH
MNQDENERELLKLVAQWRDEECLRLLDRAGDEALELLRKGYRRGRRELHEAVQTERERSRNRCAAAEAELATLRRQHRQQLGSVILAAARSRLPQRLAQRWDEQREREHWIRRAVQQALAKLPAHGWRVRHAAGLPAAEVDGLRQSLKTTLTDEPQLIPDPQLDAGLVIESGGVTLDASAAGLLSDADSLDARLLALMGQTEEDP